MSAVREIWASETVQLESQRMGRGRNQSRPESVARRREHELQRLHVVRDIILLAKAAGLRTTARLVHQLVFISQVSGAGATNYAFVQRKWTPWSNQLEADLHGWEAEQFVELVPQPSGRQPELRLGRRCRLLDASGLDVGAYLPPQWLHALAERVQNQRDMLLSAVLARNAGLGDEESHGCLTALFGRSVSDEVQGALSDADALQGRQPAAWEQQLVPA